MQLVTSLKVEQKQIEKKIPFVFASSNLRRISFALFLASAYAASKNHTYKSVPNNILLVGLEEWSRSSFFYQPCAHNKLKLIIYSENLNDIWHAQQRMKSALIGAKYVFQSMQVQSAL